MENLKHLSWPCCWIVLAAQVGDSAMASSQHATVTALFCKYDLLVLEGVVGSARAKKMLSGDTSTYLFC